MSAIFGRQWCEQSALQLSGAGNDCQQHFLACGREQDLGGAAIPAIVALGNQRSFVHAIYHLAKRAAVHPDMSGKFRQSQGALLIEGQQDTELARCNIILCGQLLVEQMDSGIEQPNEKTETLLKLERKGKIFC